MQWLIDNWDSVLTALTALHVLALFIANITPTPKDNEFIGKVYHWVEGFAGLWTKEARGVK